MPDNNQNSSALSDLFATDSSGKKTSLLCGPVALANVLDAYAGLKSDLAYGYTQGKAFDTYVKQKTYLGRVSQLADAIASANATGISGFRVTSPEGAAYAVSSMASSIPGASAYSSPFTAPSEASYTFRFLQVSNEILATQLQKHLVPAIVAHGWYTAQSYNAFGKTYVYFKRDSGHYQTVGAVYSGWMLEIHDPAGGRRKYGTLERLYTADYGWAYVLLPETTPVVSTFRYYQQNEASWNQDVLTRLYQYVASKGFLGGIPFVEAQNVVAVPWK